MLRLVDKALASNMSTISKVFEVTPQLFPAPSDLMVRYAAWLLMVGAHLQPVLLGSSPARCSFVAPWLLFVARRERHVEICQATKANVHRC